MTAQQEPDVTYRPMTDDDVEAVSLIVDEAFSLPSFASSPTVKATIRRVYVMERLSASTWTRVAVLDGEVVGVIMCHSPHQAPLPGRRARRLRRAAAMARGLVASVVSGDSDDRGVLHEVRLLEASFDQLHRRAERDGLRLEHELTLFAVSAQCRGRGVGSRLYEQATAYLRSRGASSFFLQTDSGCTYDFYERRGMERVAQDVVTLRVRGGASDLETYLYTGTL